MSTAKEVEIRLQFLEEAREYLDTLDSQLLGLSQNLDVHTLNEALRAAHSIKGGAALMGFQPLSELAHRLEDALKVLKVQRGKIEIDASLEQQLLAAVDCLGYVMGCERAQVPLDSQWLSDHAEPVFTALHDRLGEPEEEDAYSMLSPEDGHDILPLLFQSEVEGCLERLESVLAEDAPCLREEVAILAQELGGLGEMLQLEAFVGLCQGIGAEVEAAPEGDLKAVAAAALGAWRRTQALVMTGNLEAIPASFESGLSTPALEGGALNGAAIEASARETATHDDAINGSAFDGALAGEAVLDGNVLDRAFVDEAIVDESVLDEAIVDEAVVDATAVDGQVIDATAITALSHPWPIPSSTSLELEPELALEPETAVSLPPDDFSPNKAPQALETGPSSSLPPGTTSAQESWSGSPPTPEPEESTVRVPVKQINQLSDLFGELTIERNRLELEVKRLRDMVFTLQERLRTLDQVNRDLRTAYDRGVAQTPSPPLRQPPASPFSPPALAHDQHFDVLELDRYRDLHLPFREIIEAIVQLQEVGADIDLSLDSTEQSTRNLRKTARTLQKNLTQLRMRPLSDVFERFPRALRQMSLQYGKPVEIQMSGERTLVDRNVLEALQEPLMHIIRNCFDHGIEAAALRAQRGKPATGTITLAAQQQSGRTLITVRDDGDGIPIPKIRDRARQMGLDETLLGMASDQDLLSLIFEPGFSTATQVTDLSGRGVGMDVVRSKLKEIRGDIQVSTEAHVGTTFTLSIPYTLSVTRVLITESKTLRMAFPVDAVKEMCILSPEQMLSTAGKDSFEWEGEIVQLVRLADWLHFNCPMTLESPEVAPTIASPTVLLVQYNHRWVGIQVERSWGEQEVALRQVAGNLPLPPGFNSCTILGDGQVVPLVSVPDLLYWIASCEATGVTEPANADMTDLLNGLLGAVKATPAGLTAGRPGAGLTAGLSRGRPSAGGGSEGIAPPAKSKVLVIDDSINVRRLLALTLEKAGYQVTQAKDGQDALDKLSAGLEVEAVICDVEMPRLDGFGFLAKVKAQARYQHLPIAMLTSRSGQKHRKLAVSLGAAAYLTKPYNEQSLLKTLNELIAPAMAS